MNAPRPAKRWLRYAVALAAHYGGIDSAYRRCTGAGLVVLMLHRLRDEPDPYPLSLSLASFRRLLGWLRRRRALVGLDEGLRALETESRIHYAITFDDGYRDNLRLLDAGGDVPAVVYVATGHVGAEPIWAYRIQHAVEARSRDRLDLAALGLGHFDLSHGLDRDRLYAQLPPRLKRLAPQALQTEVEAIVAQLRPQPPTAAGEMLDWDGIRALRAHGVEIGGHTRGHVLLARADAATAQSEIAGSFSDIAHAIGATPRHFAYPNGGAGDFGERDVRLLRAAGYRTAVTSIEGVNRRGADPFRILRHNVHEERFRAPSGRLSPALFFCETSGVLGWLRERQQARVRGPSMRASAVLCLCRADDAADWCCGLAAAAAERLSAASLSGHACDLAGWLNALFAVQA